MDAGDQHVPQPVRKHPQETVTAAPSSCFSGVVAERSQNASSTPSPLPSVPHAGNQLKTPSEFAAACAARRAITSLAKEAVSTTEATSGHGAERHASSRWFAAAAGDTEKASLGEGAVPGASLSGGRLTLTPSSLRTGGRCRGVALGRNTCSSPPESQPMKLNRRSTAADYRWTGAPDSSFTADDDYNHTSACAAAARPAARVVRVGGPLRQQQALHEEGTSRGNGRHVPAIMERQYDSELQQIARQELEASTDSMGFTLGEIVERPTAQLRQQQSRRPQELHSQQERQHKGLQLQEMMQQTSACVPGGPVWEVLQVGAARRRDTVAAAPAGVTATAAAGVGERSFGSSAICASASDQGSCSGFLEPHNAVEATLGFPRPVHRSLLQRQLQQLHIQEGEQLQEDHGWGGEQRKTGEDQHEEKQQQESGTAAMRGRLSLKRTPRAQGTPTTACTAEAGGGLEHARSVRSWRRGADDDRANIEAEAAELLRAMQPREIAAARQELLDRFGPKRFAVLQRRALRRAAPQQQTPPTQQPAGASGTGEYACSAAGTAGQKTVCQQTALAPVGERQQLSASSSFFAPSSGVTSHCGGSASDTGSSASSAYVSFASGRRGHAISRESAPSSAGAVGKAVSDEEVNAAAAAGGPTAVPPGAASVRFDIHQVAKLRWTDPLGPEDWHSGPFGYQESLRGTGVADHALALKQFRERPGVLSAAVAAERSKPQLHGAGCAYAFANIHVHLERLRFDFDGRLRSDLLHLRDAVDAAVAGVRAAERHSRQSCAFWRRASQVPRLQGSSQQLSSQQSPDKHTEREEREKRNAALRTGESPQCAQGEEMIPSVESASRRISSLAASVREVKDGRNLREPDESMKGADNKKEDRDAAGAAVEASPAQEESEDFFGDTSDDSDPLEFYRGLHHHGDAAALPGYTLGELLHLAQSSNHAQAALALQTLAAVIRSGRTLFSCPWISEAAAFAASMRRWADQQQYTGQPKQQVLPSELRRCEIRAREKEVEHGEKRQNYDDEGQSSRQYQWEHTTAQQPAGSSETEELGPVDVAGAQDDAADAEWVKLNRVLSFSSEMQFEARAGYGLGLRRWYSYVACDLYLAWRLHALLHAQAAAIHRASLCCLAAFFGPPALSGVRRLRAACWSKRPRGNAVHDAAPCVSGRGSSVTNECSSRSSNVAKAERERSGESRCVDANVSPPSSSASDSCTACRRTSNAPGKCDSEGAVDRGHREVLVYGRGTRQDVSSREQVAGESGGAAASAFSESNLLRASEQRVADWGPGLSILPLHLKKLPRQLTTGLLKRQSRKGQQQQEQRSSAPQLPPQSASQQRVAEQQTWHRELLPQECRQRQQGAVHHCVEETDYVCVWGLGGLDFVTEGLLVVECCSGLRNIDSSESTCASLAVAVGGDSSAGCRGVFAFWHAFFGRMSSEAAAAPVCSQQPLAVSLAGSQQHRNNHKAGEEKQGEGAKTVTASSATPIERLKLKLTSAGSSEDSGVEATSLSGSRAAAAENECPTLPAANSTREGAAATTTMLQEGTLEEFLETAGAPSESGVGQSATTLLYDSVGALFSSSPVEALLEHGKLLQRLAMLLSVHRTDEDFERHALQLLLGLSASGPASTACMLAHAPLQKSIRSLAEGLLIGSVARTQRLQQQKLQQSLAVATSRAAENSSSPIAGVYFVARAELHRHMGRSSSSREGSQRSVKGSSDKTTTNRRCATSRRDNHMKDSCDSSSNPAQQEDIKLLKEGNGRGFLLRHTEYLLLRELLVLLRLWAGWAPSKIEEDRTSSSLEAAAATAWKDTLIGEDSACCALLLQSFTDGIFLVEAAATNEETLACNFSTDMNSGNAAGAGIAPRLTTRGDEWTSFVMSFGEDRRECSAAAPADEDILIAAVEAARALRVLEARGALPHTFASFYPSAVQLLHAFTKRLRKVQKELLHVSGISGGESRNELPGSTQERGGVNGQQQEENPQRGGSCDLWPELQQQMEELQQGDLDVQRQKCESEAAELSKFLLELEAPLELTEPRPTGQAVAVTEHTKTPGSSSDHKGNNSNIASNSSPHRSDGNIKRDVAFAWIFHGAFVKELLRWGAVTAAKGEAIEDASVEAHEFLLQVTPFLRLFPSLLNCWTEFESLSGLFDSFTSAAAVQVLLAATQLLLVASRRVARAVCSCDLSRSPAVGDNSVHDPLASKSASASESHFTSTNSHTGGGHTRGNESSSRESSSGGISSSSGSAGVTAERFDVRQAAVSCWIRLMKPLAESLLGPATDQTTARCSDAGSVDSAAIRRTEKTTRADPGAAAEGAADGRCGFGQANREKRGTGHRVDGCVSENGRSKTRGGLLRLMDKMKETCSRNGGSSLAKALTRYAVETGWTSVTSCCCSQCVPWSPQEDMVNDCGATSACTGYVSRPVRRSRWRGLLPATSESFAGTEVLDRFAALSAVQDFCSISARRRCRGQHANGYCVSASADSLLSVCHRNTDPSSSCSDRAEPDKFTGGSTSTGGEMAGVYGSRSCAKLDNATGPDGTSSGSDSSCKGIWMSGRSTGSANIVALTSKSTPGVPQDIELFLSEASFLSAACSWVASSLHVLHHWRPSRYAHDSADPTRERASCSSHVGDSEFSRQPQKSSEYERGNCTFPASARRDKSVFHPLDRSGNTSRDHVGKLAAAIAGRKSSEQCSIFSPYMLKQVAEAAAGLAAALRGTMRCLFQQLRCPQQSQSPLTTAARTTAGVSLSAAGTWSPEGPSQRQQQRHPQHHTVQPDQKRRQDPRQHEPVSSGQHQATATSQPVILFEPLAQLMLALQLLLRACERFSARQWNPADEQRCLLASCSAAATPRTFLRAMLMLYHSVTASSLGKVKEQRGFLSNQRPSVEHDDQLEKEAHPGPQAAWLKGAAQWFNMCCDFSLPVQHYTENLQAVSASNSTQSAEHVYKLLLQAVEQSDVPLRQRQRKDGPEGPADRAWPWVLCAVDSLDVVVNKAAKQQQDCLSSKRAKSGQACNTGEAQRPRGTLFSRQLAVCPIDGILGGSIWQCFCCDAALAPEQQSTAVDSALLSENLDEALSLCRLLVWTPNLAQELLRYVPPGAIFAALVALYTEPHLTSTTNNRSSGSALGPREATAAIGHVRGSAFSIYARPVVYDLFCRLLDKLLLQPLGKQLRDHALRQQSGKRQAKPKAGRHVQTTQVEEEQQAREVKSEPELQCKKEEDQQMKGGEQHQADEEKDNQEKHHQLDRLHDADLLLPSTPLPCEYLNFSTSFLTCFCRACQTECCASLREAQPTTAPAPSSTVEPPQDCSHWFQVCCNKAQDVLIERTARLLLISQNAADAADPLMSLLLWLLSSPAFPFECRRMLVRGERTWLKVASQLFCFVCDVDLLASLSAEQQFKCPRELQPEEPQQHQPQASRQQREQPQHVTQLAHQLQEHPRKEVKRWQQPEEPHRLSPVVRTASNTSEICALEKSLRRASCWGMQSPRGDVFWFTAANSLYVALPGLWRENSEEILVGWSLYVQSQLAKGFLLSDWHPRCENKQEATTLVPQSTQTSPPATSCFTALFPLHSLALLVADEMSSPVAPSLPALETDKAYGSTHEPAQREGQLAKRQPQLSLEQESCLSRDKPQPEYKSERENITLTPETKLNYPASTPQRQTQVLSNPGLQCDPCRAAESTSARRKEDIETRFSKLKRLLKADSASKSYSAFEADVEQVADNIARIICGSRVVARRGERSP